MYTQIEKACETLRAGGVILYPTDTIWGIGCDATNPDAVRRVYELKRRADHKAMILLVASKADAEALVGAIPAEAAVLIEDQARPTTVVYDRCRGVAEALKGADGSVGVRVTHEEFSRELCRAFGRPLVSTSANISGEPAARSFDEISPEIIAGVDFAVDWRREPEPPASPSRVVRVTADGNVTVLRP